MTRPGKEADDRPATQLFDALPLGEHHPGESVTNQGRVALAAYLGMLAALEAAIKHLCFYCSTQKPFNTDGTKHEVQTVFAMAPDKPVMFTPRCYAVPERKALATERKRIQEAGRGS